MLLVVSNLLRTIINVIKFNNIYKHYFVIDLSSNKEVN